MASSAPATRWPHPFLHSQFFFFAWHSVQAQFCSMTGAVRQRDLLPLRLPCGEAGLLKSNLSRGTRQRIRRRLGAEAWFREGVETLNHLYGKPGDASCPAPVAGQAASLARLERMYKAVGPPPQSRPEEALEALLGGMTLYSQDTDCTIARFDETLVSWPSPGSCPVNVAERLDPATSHLLSLAGMPALLAEEGSAPEEEVVKPYIDPALASSPTSLGRFYGRLHQSHMLTFVSGRHAHTVGVFFVHKKSGKLRLILDTRAANRAFRKPMPTRLPTPAAWSSIEVASEDTLYTAAGDVADAFHRMALPVHLRRFFRLPAIKCKFVDRKLWPAGCNGEDYITPEYATLPMGWSWSLFFCQHVLQSAAAQAGLQETDCIEDRSWIGQVSEGRAIHAEYVDNFFVCGTDREFVQQSFDCMKGVLELWGFAIHEVTDAQPIVEGLGLRFDGAEKRVMLTSHRVWKLRLSAIALGRLRGPPPPKWIEKIVGHFTFAMMVRREALSIFSSVYKYIRASQPGPDLWHRARDEIVQASALLPLLSTSWALPWDATISATDSSEVGYGVCERSLAPAVVADCGRSCEQWRYSVAGAIKARANALGLKPEEHLPADLQQECARVCSSEFKEIPAGVLSFEAWHTVFSGAWDFNENILRTEGRAMISGIRHKLRALQSQQRRHLVLVDNLSLALGVCKGRSGSSLLNNTCRQVCALSLASDCRVHVRWIPSERNCADKPSRQPFSSLHPQCAVDEAAPTHGGPGVAPSSCEASASAVQDSAGRPCSAGCTSHPGRSDICTRDGEASAYYDTGPLHQSPPGLLPVGAVLPEPDLGLGRPPDRLPERALRVEPKRQRRGVRFRRVQVQAPPVRQAWVSDATTGHSGPRRIQKSGSAPNEAAYAVDRFHRHRGLAFGARGSADGNRPPHSVGSSFAARRTDWTSTAAYGPADADGQHAVLGGGTGPIRRKQHAQQSQCLRRECNPQPTSGVRLARSRGASGHTSQVRPPVSLHRSAARTQVQRGRRLPEPPRAQPDSAWKQTWRRKRSSSARNSAERNQEERAMGCRLQSPQVREGNSGPTADPQSTCGHPPVRCLRGAAVASQCPTATTRSDVAERVKLGSAESAFQAPASTLSDVKVRKHLRGLLYRARKAAQIHKHQVFLELFSGSQKISRCLRNLGFGVVSLDIASNPCEDVCHPAVLSTLKGWIANGAVLGVWLGCPCTTWSVAHASPVVRTRKYLLGVPNLCGKHLRAVQLGNATMIFSAIIIEQCIRAAIPCLLENPHSSKLFLAEPIAQLRVLSCCQEFVSDYCQYGAQWKKRTRVCGWHCLSEAPVLKCAGAHGLCSRSGCKHLRLCGHSPQGRSWTAVAQAYPPQMGPAVRSSAG